MPSLEQRRALADQLAAERGWRAETLTAGEFELRSYLPERFEPSAQLAVYIEGDGFAWLGPSQPSADPTPRDPLALRLALAQPRGNAAYLARPCQYVGAGAQRCPRRYWTAARFAPELVDASNRALDELARRAGASRLTLVGYSGGAALAALLAARRGDVERLVSVAGNLDHRSWTALHGVDPLTGSLDPTDEIGALARVPQLHLVGAADRNVTPALVQGFARRFPPGHRPPVQVEPGFDHSCCWAQAWPALAARALALPEGAPGAPAAAAAGAPALERALTR